MEKITLANRLSLRIMLVVTVMTIIIMVVVYSVTMKSMIQEAESRYETVILVENEKIRGVLSDVYVAAINNVANIERDIDDPGKLQAHLERMVSLNKYMSSCRLIFEPDFYPQLGHRFEIYAWRDSSNIIKGRQMNEKHPDFIEHAWYKDAFNNPLDDWTPPYFDKAASQQLTTTYLIHIRDHKGRIIGMFGADVSLEWLRLRHKREYATIHERYEKGFDNQSYSFIIDQDGTYLIHPNEERVLKEKFQDVAALSPDTVDDYMVRQMLNGESGVCRLTKDGLRCTVFYSYVKYADWTLVIVVPEAIINYKGNLLAAIILAVLFLGLMLVYLLSHQFIKKILLPLKPFVTAAGQVAQGDFNIQLPEVKSREVSALRDAFTDMQGSLTKYIDELKTTTASKVAFEQELKIASDIQQQMLPKVYPPFPERNDIDI